MCTHLFCFHKRIAAALEVFVKIDSSELTSSLSLTVTLTEVYAAHTTGEIVVVNGLKFSFSHGWTPYTRLTQVEYWSKLPQPHPAYTSSDLYFLHLGSWFFTILCIPPHSSLDQGDSPPFCPWGLLGLGTPSSSIPPSQHLNVGPRVFVLHYVWMYFYLCGLCRVPDNDNNRNSRAKYHWLVHYM